jgi:hypothetical protein
MRKGEEKEAAPVLRRKPEVVRPPEKTEPER